VAAPREYLLVDGHSVIFAWPDLRALHVRRMAAARDALIKILTDYQDQSGVRVVLVFDGRGARATQESDPDGIQIFYAQAGGTADQLIERLVAKYAAVHRLTVATSDRLEQQTAISFGAAQCVSAEQLRDRLEAANRDFARQTRAYRANRTV
jgi:predicted RNA-binding protein with PIN domain